MEPSGRLARAAGLCYFVTHVTSIGGLVLYGPVLNDPGYVLGAGPDGRVLLGALLEVLLALGIVGTAVTLYPVTRRHNEAAAVGYVALRVLEAAVIAVGIVGLLAVVTLRRHGADGADPAALATTARALVAVHDWTFLLGPNFVCGANTLLAAYLMYRSRLVPRFVAVLGLIGGPLIFASAVAVLFGGYTQVSAWGALAAVPVFAWELTLAASLVTRGFARAAAPVPARRLKRRIPANRRRPGPPVGRCDRPARAMAPTGANAGARRLPGLSEPGIPDVIVPCGRPGAGPDGGAKTGTGGCAAHRHRR